MGDTELCFIGATLPLRGAEPILQPMVGQSGNVLVYNGKSAHLKFSLLLLPIDSFSYFIVWNVCYCGVRYSLYMYRFPYSGTFPD